ncbi:MULTISPECIES: hypothetical protein [Brasilonema]|nr:MULTISPECIES: hypothetical protein [Brasilonema]
MQTFFTSEERQQFKAICNDAGKQYGSCLACAGFEVDGRKGGQ